MLLKEILDLYDILDRPGMVGKNVTGLFDRAGIPITLKRVTGRKGVTEFVKIIIPGLYGKTAGGKNPTLGVIGYLGGIGNRPENIGFASDGDGALTALAVALRLARMSKNGDVLDGDVIITTHLCTSSPVIPHEPVAFMDSPVNMTTLNKYLVDPAMDAILSVDTSRGNKIIKQGGFAFSPTVKEGWILKVSEGLIGVMETVTGLPAKVLPITMQDITPYANNLYHFNSIMQPAVSTNTPVVGVALTSMLPVPGVATGVTNAPQIDEAGRFVIEAAKQFVSGNLVFYDEKEFRKLTTLYGKMAILQSNGNRK